MVFIRCPLVVKFLQRQKVIILREILYHRSAEDGHVARRAFLMPVRQAAGIAEGRPVHAKGAGFRRHHAGEFHFALRHGFRKDSRRIIGRFGNQAEHGVLYGYAFPFSEAKLGWRLTRGTRGNRKLLAEA